MSFADRRAAPGPQLSAGRLRVDAARAIAKLREYQLAVRAAWVLEAIRAAVAAGASRISLAGDTNDLWLAWDGEPWPAADLPRLFDELVGPEASDARYAVRLLAAAVNSALGMDPAYVDVFAVAGPGQAMRARYTPDVLAEPEGDLGEAPLRRITAQPAAPPPGANRGMAVHLRRRFGVAVISHLVRELPEVALARASCADIEVPLFIRGVEHRRGLHARDAVRVPLGEGLHGFLAILDPDGPDGPDAAGGAPGEALLEIAELGAVLATGAIDLGLSSPHRTRPVPVRVFVDGPRMPTNASRSEVRHDLPPVAAALRRARALLPEAAERLAAELTAGARPDRARAAALALLAAVGRTKEAAVEAGLGRLIELPLVRDAVGTPRPLSSPWRDLVHTGASPFPQELAPWLCTVLWAPPGDPAAQLVDMDAVDPRAMKQYAREARREYRAMRRFYGHAPRAASVQARELPRMRARLGARVDGSGADPAVFEGLSGEVCIAPRGEGGELVFLLEGREIERVSYASPIPFSAAVDSPRLAPVDRYRGVARDAEYARVEAAMRAGVLCAVEAIAAGEGGAGREGSGFVAGPADGGDARLAIDGLSLALELARRGVRLVGPLFEAPVWSLAGGGGAASVRELRAAGLIGVCAPGARLRPLANRRIAEVAARDRELFEALMSGGPRCVVYDGDALDPDPADALELARELAAGSESGVALAVRAEGCAGAITPAASPRVALAHMGRRLEERPHQPLLVPCHIVGDADGAVPGPDWRSADDDGGISRHLAGWERELLRAIAAALAGSRSTDLVGEPDIEASGAPARALWVALAQHEAGALLGDELAERLRDQPMLRILGEAERISPRELAKRFPHEVLFLDAVADPVPGFAPLAATAAVAAGVARLARRLARDAAPQLERRRRAAAREVKLASLRALPPLPFERPGVLHVRRESPPVRALVAVGGAGMEIEVRVEGHPLAALVRAGELPVSAIVEVPLDRLDESFEAVPPALESAIVRTLRGAVPDLLVAIAQARPTALADLGPERALVAAALSALYIEPPVRAALIAAEAFPTVQGDRISLAAAARDGALATASWEGTWLPPDEGEAPSELDAPVLHVPARDTERAGVIARLHRHAVADLTEAVAKLQAQRRMRRGLLPAPALGAVPAELKRKLADLGPAGAALGVGEIGLVDEPLSTAMLHTDGELREEVTLDVLPCVHLALEAPDLVRSPVSAAHALRGPAQELARALALAVLAALPSPPDWLRRRLRRALLSNRLPPELDRAAVFETASGAWVDRAAVARQLELFEVVWCVRAPDAAAVPLDERRLVLALPAEEQSLARRAGIPCIDATRELELDAVARANRARPPAAQLALDPAIPVLATVALDGDGRTAPRGVVAVLAPSGARFRGILPHREMLPFAPAGDECLWPTRAIVDDARLAPNRTWARIAEDEAWRALVAEILRAADRGLAEIARPPARALASMTVEHRHHAALDGLRGDALTQLRGALWLEGPPGEPGRIDVHHSSGAEAYTPDRGAPLRGTLFVSASMFDARIREVVAELCLAAHTQLLRTLVARPAPSDLATAHVALGLALGRIEAKDATAVRFGCFRARPLDAAEWQALCRSTQRLRLVAPDAVVDELCVAVDGTATARIVLGVLGDRVYRERPVPVPVPARPPERLGPVLRDAAPPRPQHPLDPLISALGARLRGLGLPPPRFAILDGAKEPLLAYRDDALCLAGAAPRLRAISAALGEEAAWSAAAVEAVAAHAVSVLNLALTSVTDATELRALGALLEGQR